MKKRQNKVLFIMGAGASIVLGMPSVNDINDLYLKYSREELSNGEESRSPVHVIKNILDQHQIRVKNSLSYLGDTKEDEISPYNANFESIQYALNLISSIQQRIPGLDETKRIQGEYLPLYKLLKANETLDSLNLNNLYYIGHALNYQVTKLMIECALKVEQHPNFTLYQSLLHAISKKHIMSIATLNYDDIVLKMLPWLNNGFDRYNGPFRPEKLFANHWRTCLPLHGSIHMYVPKDSAKSELLWRRNPQVNDEYSGFGKQLRTDEGLVASLQPMIIGYNKPDAILTNPFRLYFSLLERLIYEADSIVICGYGFGDLHLNRYLSAIRYYQNQPKKIVIIDKKNDGYSIADSDPWSRTIRAIFRLKSHNIFGYNQLSSDDFIMCRMGSIQLRLWTKGLDQIIENPQQLLTAL